MPTKHSFARNTVIVSVIFAVSNILGLIRESSIAYMFGASGITDAYLIAMIIPSLFIGTISTAFAGPFITVYGSYIAKGENDKAWQMCNTIISFFIIFFSILFIILFVFTSSFVHLVAPTYSGEIMILTVNLTRMLLPTVIFSSLLSILIGINNANHSFIAPASNGLILKYINYFKHILLRDLMGSLWFSSRCDIRSVGAVSITIFVCS